MITFGPAFAPVVSGLMETTFGWRSVFVPPAVIVALLALAGVGCIGDVSEPRKTKLDALSVALSAAGLFALVYGLSAATQNPPIAAVMFAAGAAGIGGFVARQRVVSDPLLDLSPLRNPQFAAACVLVIVAMTTTFSMSVLLPLYFEGSLGMTAFAAGALLLAPILANAGTALVGGRAMDRRGAWPLLPAGFALIAAGQLAVCLVAPHMSRAAVLAGSIAAYAGVGLVFSPSQTAGLQTLECEQNASGVAIVNTFIQVAACIGPSLFIGILLTASSGAASAGASAALAQAEGFSAAVAAAAAIAVAGFAVSFFYARRLHAGSGRSQAASAPKPVAPTVGDIMKRDAYTVAERATVLDAMRILLDRKTSGLPVVDDEGSVVGFISDGDIMKALALHKPEGYDLAYGLAVYRDDEEFNERLLEVIRLDVMDIATANVVAVPADSSIEDVCRVLGSKRIKKVPIVRDGALVGTVSRADVTRHLMGAFVKSELP